ncbi:excalibur calcium-binding domain-containing protein [Shewanella sp. 1CM18E]|uniref:excalibur calcium-binding domain-containing protein n=1 Tax=Shewanella sp. 1CM18E TaxID=2929169 RepID=UPI0020BF9F96|nr:excalibur calcium-binding domain-containing protein [Shewanella sp. 1CM18E]MCK8045892.1 excalibur calcium-binding domain-containing protein [Shewanella sp. 1CM18E]
MLMERGTLVRWNADKGFGFIKPEAANAKDVFIHISTLKHMARKPIVGDQILFHREQQADGKVKASKASIEGVAVIATSTGNRHRKNHSHRNKPSFLSKLAIPAIIAIVALGYSQYQRLNQSPVISTHDIEQTQWQLAPTQNSNSLSNQPQFHCETGKTHCSQMSSCDEAKFYIKNCPGTKMDGDGDGTPCERQHCNWW